MNLEALGAFETVSYLRQFMRAHRNRRDLSRLLDAELDALAGDIAEGAAADFRERLASLRG